MLLVKKGIFKIPDKRGRTVRFIPNSAQRTLINEFENADRKNDFVRLIVVKGRQMGVSAVLERLALSYAMTNKNFQAYTTAHDLQSVKKLFESHVKFSFDTLPLSFKSAYRVNRDNSYELSFENEAAFNSSMGVGVSARSQTLKFLHISEAAKISHNQAKWNEVLTGSLPAAEFGHTVLESTAGGLDMFYEFTMRQINDPTTIWKILFFAWFTMKEYAMRPPLDNDWLKMYAVLAEKHGLEKDPMKKYGISLEQLFFYYRKAADMPNVKEIRQEYPFSLEEAFSASTGSIFNDETIKYLLETASVGVDKNGVYIYEEPIPGHEYVIGIDPVSGESNSKEPDEAAISVWNKTTGNHAAEVSGLLQPEEVAVIACNLGYYYQTALLIPETNFPEVMHEILKLEYPKNKIFRRYVTDVTDPLRTRIPKYGFFTQRQNRGIVISDFRQAIDQDDIKPNSKKLIKQMATFVRKDNGKIEHQSGQHDDCVLAAILAHHGMNYVDEFIA